MFRRTPLSRLAVALAAGTLAGFMPTQDRVMPLLAAEGALVYACPMHSDVQSATKGKCRKCHMELVEVPASRAAISYSCAAHPTVQLRVRGVCPRCGAPLVPSLSIAKYRVDLRTNPPQVHAGAKAELRLTIRDPESGQIVQRFNTVHEKLIHLFVISRDLAHYQHIHPVQQSDGTFVVETVLPQEGSYYVISDFFPVGGWPQVTRETLVTAGASTLKDFPLNVKPDTTLSKVVDGTRFHLTLDPPQPAAGVPVVLKYTLTDASTGLPVRDLEPYLAAWGHTILLNEDGQDYVHSHPKDAVPANATRSNLVVPPAILFDSFFPRPGRYRVWSQFQRHGRVSTVSYDLDVSVLDAVARWNGTRWSALEQTADNTFDGSVRASAVSGGDLYVGGDFTHAGSLPLKRVAKWDGRKWSGLGEGVNGPVWALAVRGSDVYVGGDFTMAGGLSANRVAKWDGHRWSAVGGGVSGCEDSGCSPVVYALALDGMDLYAAGRFSIASGTRVNGIARWSNNRWQALGEGVRTGIYDGVIRALALSSGSVYVGGTFNSAGRITAKNIARWTGSDWAALGAGIGGGVEQVLAVGVQGSTLYAGGAFTAAGGINVSNAAVWNGQQWSRPQFQADGPVQAITVEGTQVYMGGSTFTLPSGHVAKGVIRLTGSGWSGLASGLSYGGYLAPVMSLTVAGKSTYAAGGPFAFLTTDVSSREAQHRASTARAGSDLHGRGHRSRRYQEQQFAPGR